MKIEEILKENGYVNDGDGYEYKLTYPQLKAFAMVMANTAVEKVGIFPGGSSYEEWLERTKLCDHKWNEIHVNCRSRLLCEKCGCIKKEQ